MTEKIKYTPKFERAGRYWVIKWKAKGKPTGESGPFYTKAQAEEHLKKEGVRRYYGLD